MSAPSQTLSATDPVIGLRRKHQAFLARIGTDPPSLDERKAFMAELQQAGRFLPDEPGDKRRSAVRNMLFYWAGDATTRGERSKDAELPQLDGFVGEGTAGAEPAADLGPPVSGPVPESADASGSSATAANAPTTVPLTDIEEMARARIILRYSGFARQWKLAEPAKQADFLLKGSPLAEASLYVNDDPDIRAHVEASEAARDAARNAEITLRNRQQKQRIAFLSGLLIFALAMVGALLWQSYQLRVALKEATEQRRAALDALEARDKAERQKAAALDELAAPDRKEQLDKRQQAIEPPTASNISEAPRRPTPPLATAGEAPVAQPVADACSGYLWLGSAAESRLMGGQLPTTLKPGDKATINMVDDLRLRETAPSFNYQMGRQTGLVPAGSTVTIGDVLEPYIRSSGAQYWAQVLVPRQFCTSVFVQYAGTSPTKLDAVKSDLLGIGVQTPPAEELASARGRAEVRYYWAADAPIAQQVATTLGKFTRDGKPLRLTPLTDFPPAAKARATTIEVWLDLDALKP